MPVQTPNLTQPTAAVGRKPAEERERINMSSCLDQFVDDTFEMLPQEAILLIRDQYVATCGGPSLEAEKPTVEQICALSVPFIVHCKFAQCQILDFEHIISLRSPRVLFVFRCSWT